MFYGIIISMFYRDCGRHHLPHIHVKYQDCEAIIAIPSGEVLGGALPPKKMLLVQAWISLHEEELMANWEVAINGENIVKIEPLR